MVKTIIIISILCRLLGQMQTYSDDMYFMGRDLFDCGMLAAMYMLSDGWIRKVLAFSFGYALWNLIEPVFQDPTKLDWIEYEGFVIGLLFLIVDFIYGKRS